MKEFAVDALVECALYAKEKNLLGKDGWKRFNRIVEREGLLERLVKQARLASFRSTPKYNFGYEVPKNYEHACKLDDEAGNDKWKIATKLEMDQIKEYEVFIDKGKYHVSKIPRGFKEIRCHIVFDVKHDGRHKARLVAGGHMTDTPIDSVYSGVVSLRGFRMCLFLAELNGLDAYTTDISNAYLEGYTREKLVVRAGKEFGDQSGNLLIVSKSLYGLISSGLRFNGVLAKCLSDIGFKRSKCESDIWYRDKGDHYEYIGTYVDDLIVVLRDC